MEANEKVSHVWIKTLRFKLFCVCVMMTVVSMGLLGLTQIDWASAFTYSVMVLHPYAWIVVRIPLVATIISVFVVSSFGMQDPNKPWSINSAQRYVKRATTAAIVASVVLSGVFAVLAYHLFGLDKVVLSLWPGNPQMLRIIAVVLMLYAMSIAGVLMLIKTKVLMAIEEQGDINLRQKAG